MNSILKKIRQSDAFNKENRIPCTKAIMLMSLFTFTFLGAEFLFVDMISRIVSGNQSVSAQNYALGISVIGFVLYPLFCRVCKGKLQSAVTMGAAILSVVCLFVVLRIVCPEKLVIIENVVHKDVRLSNLIGIVRRIASRRSRICETLSHKLTWRHYFELL